MNISETYDKKITRYLYPLLIIICGIAFFSRLPHYMDILFSDEGNYNLIARNMFATIEYNFGPLYSVWLKLWSYIFSDPVQLYYLNYAALSIIVPLLLYFLLIRLSFNPHAAFFVALSFLYSIANVTLWPRVSHFSLVIILSGLLLALRCTRWHMQWLVLAVTLLVTSYARTEFYGLSCIFFLVSLFYIWKERSGLHKIPTGILVFFFLVIFLFIKTPENNYDPTGHFTRSFTAFIQHYYLGLTFEGKKFDFWWLSAKDFYYFGEFKDCEGSLFKFITLHSHQFMHHVLFDIKMYLLQLFSKLLLITNPVFTKFSPRHLLISSVLIAGALGIFITNAATRSHCLSLIKKNKFIFFILFLLILPPLAASILILPRDHYIFLQVPFFILFTGIYAELLFTRIPNLKFILIPLAIICLFFQYPGRYNFIKAGQHADINTNVKLIRYMRDSLPQKSYQVFTDNLYITGLLPERFTEPTLMEYSFDFKNFKQFITAKKINLVITTPMTNTEPYLRRDSTWNNFLLDPATIGFHRINAGETDSTYQLYIK